MWEARKWKLQGLKSATKGLGKKPSESGPAACFALSSTEALVFFVSDQVLAQVAEFALPLRSLSPLGGQCVPGFLLIPDKCPSPWRPKTSLLVLYLIPAAKTDSEVLKAKGRRPAKEEACSENTGKQHVNKGIFSMVSRAHSAPGVVNKGEVVQVTRNSQDGTQETVMRRVQRGYEGPWLPVISTAKALKYN